MTCREKHNLRETVRHLKALAAVKGAPQWKSYEHAKGKCIATMARAEAEQARLDVVALFSKCQIASGMRVDNLPEDARPVVERSQYLAGVISDWRKARALQSLTIPRELAPVHAIRPAPVAAVDERESFRAEMRSALDAAALAIADGSAPLAVEDKPLADVVELRGERTQIACMGCFWPHLPHGCGKGQASAR